ncbi:GxxExxY protein [Pontiellaceae bacterium B12219]|nr:GxxExxY protein [Pontiellaceae bacterium B12219]
MEWKTINELCDAVRKTSLDIHQYHRSGHLEKIYENALAHRLRKLGLDVKQQYQLTVYDEDGTELGEYFADLLIEGQLIIELKACKSVSDEHVAQILGYLRSSGIEHGLLINFGAPKLFIKKYILNNNPRLGSSSLKSLLLSLCAAAFFSAAPCASLWLIIHQQ